MREEAGRSGELVEFGGALLDQPAPAFVIGRLPRHLCLHAHPDQETTIASCCTTRRDSLTCSDQ